MPQKRHSSHRLNALRSEAGVSCLQLMKTIQQVIKELNPKDIEFNYFAAYPIHMYEISSYKNKSIGEFCNQVSENFQSFLNDIKTYQAKDKKQPKGIFFVSKSLNESAYSMGHEVCLVYIKDLKEKSNLEEIRDYTYDFTNIEDVIGYYVADTDLTQKNLMDIVIDFLFKISLKKMDIINEKNLDIEGTKEKEEETRKVIKESIDIDYDEFIKSFDIQPEEEYPLEDELKTNYDIAIFEYNDYCRNVELQKIKNSLQNTNC